MRTRSRRRAYGLLLGATAIDTQYACGFALANDGNAILPLSAGPGFVFGTFSHVLTPMADTVSCGAAASGNGAIVSLNGSTLLASSETVEPSGPAGAVADFVGDK